MNPWKDKIPYQNYPAKNKQIIIIEKKEVSKLIIKYLYSSCLFLFGLRYSYFLALVAIALFMIQWTYKDIIILEVIWKWLTRQKKKKLRIWDWIKSVIQFIFFFRKILLSTQRVFTDMYCQFRWLYTYYSTKKCIWPGHVFCWFSLLHDCLLVYILRYTTHPCTSLAWLPRVGWFHFEHFLFIKKKCMGSFEWITTKINI